MLDNFKKRIDSIKESLATLPINNRKNRQKYLDYLNDLIQEYSTLKDNLLKEMNTRYEKLYKKNVDDVFGKLDEKKDEYKDIFNTLNKWNTPYEKIGLDKLVFKLTHFYQNNFENLNQCISSCLACFKKVGLTLTEKDFNHNPHVKEYMHLFLVEHKNNNKLKELFDRIYWECPNIIFYIALNFRCLYYKNEKIFLSYYQLKEKNILKEKNNESIKKEYATLIYKIETKDDNITTITNKLLTREYNLKDYSKQMELTYYTSLTSKEVEISNILKLYNSLYEYKGYLESEFVIEKIKKLYEEKDKYKNAYKINLKEIAKIESKIIKLNNKYNFYKKYFNNENKLEHILLEINKQLEQARTKYDELDNNKFYDKISTLTVNASYFDILSLANSYYLNIRKIIKEEFNENDEEAINYKINSLDKFLDSSNLNILRNIKIKECIDIALVISDRYKLLNLNISKDNISNNYAMLIDYITKLKRIDIINKSDITYEELQFLCEVNEIRS